MQTRIFLPFFFTLIANATSPANAPVLRSPILPEVSDHLRKGYSDVDQNHPAMARAHAMVVLLGQDLTYHVSFQNVPARKRAPYQKMLESALREWEGDLEQTVRFHQVPTGEASDIQVTFQPSVKMKGEEVAGYVTWKRSISEIDGAPTPHFTADLQIRTVNLDGSPMPTAAVRHASMHEFGHVLGLDDSPNGTDVMGPLDVSEPLSRPTALEVATVRDLRDQASEIVRESTASASR